MTLLGRSRTLTTALLAAAACAALALVVDPPRAAATTVEALSDADLVKGARTIAHADVTEKRSVRLADGSGRIYTEYRFRVRELMKGAATEAGSAAVPPSVVFREWGGEADGVRYWIPGVNGYEPGEEVVAFLGDADPRTGVGFTYGLAQGKFKIEREATTGKARLTRRLAALELAPRGAGGAVRPGAPLVPPGTEAEAPVERERELDAFKAFVRTEVRK